VREKVTSLFLHPVVGLTVLAIAVFISTFFVSIEEADPTLPEADHSLSLKITPAPGVKAQPVVVALQRIKANTRVTTSAIGLRFFPEPSDSPPGVLFTKQDAVGKLAKLEIPPGQVILQSMLTSTQFWGKSVYPALAGELIFYTSEHRLYAVEAKTGEEVWHYEPKDKDWSLTSPPVAAADLVYYAVVFSGHFSDRTQIRLYAVEVQTGRVRWSFTHQDVARREDVPLLAPVVGEGIVCFVSWGNHDLYGFDAEIGYKKWQFKTDELISAPGIANGTVSFISSDGYLHNLEAQTGKERWRVEQK
jgi:outer membrane protein assembly factor BamB